MAVVLGLASASCPAVACNFIRSLDLQDIRLAEIVVVGRIENIRTYVDPAQLRYRSNYVADQCAGYHAVGRPPEDCRRLQDLAGTVFDDIRFDVVVDEVVLGRAAGRVAVWWDRSHFTTPTSLPGGPVLIGMRAVGNRLSEAMARYLPSEVAPRPSELRIVHDACHVPFLVDSASAEAATLRSMLRAREDAVQLQIEPR